ncbi:MAG: alanine racemase [Acidimicrobiia bacterium]|nr:alanine racemase [Acidimicrobiia bacterium]
MRPSWVEVDLQAIKDNVSAIVDLVAPARFCAVVKANAYGHGDVPVAKAALEAGANMLAVATVEEGARLREADITQPILLLAQPPLEDINDVLHWKLSPTIYHPLFLESFLAAIDEQLPRVHIKFDSGMHRLGTDGATVQRLAAAIARSPKAELGGIWSHFADADSDPEFTNQQLDLFNGFVSTARDTGLKVPLVHIANSAAALLLPRSRQDMVRIGLAMYGLHPAPRTPLPVKLRPAMAVKSQVVHVRRLPAGARPSYGRIRELESTSNVATVPIGYADGVTRRLATVKGAALIGGKRRPFAGRVTMDYVVLDMGPDPVEIGDEVVLLGTQGDGLVPAQQWAEWLDTISYEVVCGFGERLPRKYV